MTMAALGFPPAAGAVAWPLDREEGLCQPDLGYPSGTRDMDDGHPGGQLPSGLAGPAGPAPPTRQKAISQIPPNTRTAPIRSVG